MIPTNANPEEQKRLLMVGLTLVLALGDALKNGCADPVKRAEKIADQLVKQLTKPKEE